MFRLIWNQRNNSHAKWRRGKKWISIMKQTKEQMPDALVSYRCMWCALHTQKSYRSKIVKINNEHETSRECDWTTCELTMESGDRSLENDRFFFVLMNGEWVTFEWFLSGRTFVCVRSLTTIHFIQILLGTVRIIIVIASVCRWLLLRRCRHNGGRRCEWSGQYIDNSQTKYATYDETTNFVRFASIPFPLDATLKWERKKR